MEIPDWLKIEEPIKNDLGWMCPYCYRTFDNKEKARPKIIENDEKIIKICKNQKNFKEFLKKWNSGEGHYCELFTNNVWDQYQDNVLKYDPDDIEDEKDEKLEKEHKYGRLKFLLASFFTVIFIIICFFGFIKFVMLFVKENYHCGPPHIIPQIYIPGSFIVTKEFNYEGKRIKVSVPIDYSIYYGAKYGYRDYKCPCPQVPNCENICNGKYGCMAIDPNQKKMFDEIIKELKKYSKNNSLEFVKLATTLVQSTISYNYKKADYEIVLRKNQKILFPVETFVEGKGICVDQALLLAGILYYAGYNVSLVGITNLDYNGIVVGHIAVAVQCKGKKCSKNGWCYLEATGYQPLCHPWWENKDPKIIPLIKYKRNKTLKKIVFN